MSEFALLMEHVYKKFRKGETYNSLRDLLPAMTGKMIRGEELNQSDNRSALSAPMGPEKAPH